jgi:hypothetical protein
VLIFALIPAMDTAQHARVVGSVTVVVVYCSGFLVRAVTKPVYTIAQMLFYYDQRIRNEGFDIEWLMRQAGMVEAPAPEAVPWMPPVRTAETADPAMGSAGAPVEAPAVEAQPAEAAEPAALAGAEHISSEALPPATGEPA